jgi:protein TonB
MGKLQHTTALGLAVMMCASLLASCGKEPPRRTEAATRPAGVPRTPLPAEQVPVPPLQPPIHTLDDYKRALAARILAATPDGAFTGALPPLLTSIVVVEAKIGRDGDLVNLRVVRSRDQKASNLALAAMRAAEPYPKPGKLMESHHKTFDMSETFLFNKDYRFQIRTLAPVQ